MSERIRAGNSWVDFYARQRDEVGTETFPGFEESKVAHAVLLPTCPNCGWTPEAATEPIPDRCPMCWGRLQAVKS
jgi:rubrerythrin